MNLVVMLTLRQSKAFADVYQIAFILPCSLSVFCNYGEVIKLVDPQGLNERLQMLATQPSVSVCNCISTSLTKAKPISQPKRK